MRHLALSALLFALPIRAQAEKHIITLSQANAMIDAYQTQKGDVGTVVPDVRALAYDAQAVLKLLAQPGAASIGIYKGIDNGKETFVLMAIDVVGNRLDGVNVFAIEGGIGPCPPCNP